MKFLTVNETFRAFQMLAFELRAYTRIAQDDKQTAKADRHPGRKFIAPAFDIFRTSSIHGPHLCFVTEPCGLNIEELQLEQPNRQFCLSVVKRIIKQTLLAVDYMHSRLNMVHAGMLRLI